MTCHILSCVEDLATTLKILEFLFFSHSLSRLNAYPLALLQLDEEDVYLARFTSCSESPSQKGALFLLPLHLSELQSVLHIPSPPNISRVWIYPAHASLQDFLVDKPRSAKYYPDEEAFHTDLVQQCVRQDSTLSIKQAWEGVYSLKRYLTSSFISTSLYSCCIGLR